MIGAYIGIGAGGVLALLLAVLIIRALCFKPRAQVTRTVASVTFDREKAVNDLAESGVLTVKMGRGLVNDKEL